MVYICKFVKCNFTYVVFRTTFAVIIAFGTEDGEGLIEYVAQDSLQARFHVFRSPLQEK